MVWIRNSVFFFALVFAQPKKISSSGTKLFSNTIYTFFAPLVLVSVLTFRFRFRFLFLFLFSKTSLCT
jgi:hypothetical protein